METKYKLAIISDKGKIDCVERKLEKPSEGQVLVKVDACAICTLEQRIYSGSMARYPFAGGHEVAGHVEEVGDKVTQVKPGDKVALRLLTACGECYYCRSGNDNQCVISFKTQIHEGYPGPGGFAEYMMISSRAVYKTAEDLDPTYAALTEPLACCVHSINRAKINFGDDVVVIGNGIMGGLHIKLAKLRGARVIACELSDERLEIAKKCGADVLINSSKENAIEKIKELTDGRGANVVVNTVANSKVAQDSINMAGKLGRVIFYSSFHPDNPIETSPNKIHYSEAILTGSVNPGTSDFLEATRLLSSKIIDPSIFISDVVPFEELEEGFKKALDPMSFRIIVKM